MSELQLPPVLSEFVAAVNRQDEATFLAAFLEQATVDDWGLLFVGRRAIKKWSDRELIGVGATFTTERLWASGERITLVGEWHSVIANGRSALSFRMVDGLVASLTIRGA